MAIYREPELSHDSSAQGSSSKSNQANSAPSAQTRDAALLRLIELSAAADTSVDAWVASLHSLGELTSLKTQHTGAVNKVLVLETIDRFRWTSAQTQLEFAKQLFLDGRWKTDATEALILAGTAGASPLLRADEARAMAAELVEWLQDDLGKLL